MDELKELPEEVNCVSDFHEMAQGMVDNVHKVFGGIPTMNPACSLARRLSPLGAQLADLDVADEPPSELVAELLAIKTEQYDPLMATAIN